MPFPSGHLQQHPVPPGVTGALGLGGYQLLVDIAGVGAGRIGQQIFLLAVPEPDPAVTTPGTQLVLHQGKLRSESDAPAFLQLAAQLGYLRLSGYRLVLERTGLRSKLNVLDPATGAIMLTIPEKHPGGLFGGGARSAPGMLVIAKALPPAGAAPDLQNSPMLGDMLLGLALADDTLNGAEAVDVADGALVLMRQDTTLDPAAALQAAKRA